MRVLFAHGFEGSPSGSKPTYMKEALGWDVTAPKMSELGWSIASQTEVLLRLLDEDEFDLVVGSSMGGLAVANASSMRPQMEIKLLLIAPAFGLAENWEGMGETGRSAWKTTGERRYTGFELDIVLPWEFMESAEEMSWPVPAHPTAIMHGKFDEVVPISFSRKVAEDCEDVRLHEIDDSHRMKKSMRFIPEIASNLIEGTEISSFEMLEDDDGDAPESEEKLEEPEEPSPEVSESEEASGVEDQPDIERLEAEMKELEAELEKKKTALEESKVEALPEQSALEEDGPQEERERESIEASDAIIKADEAVELARKEVEEATQRAEEEGDEAEEARLIAEIEEDEAKEAQADADAAKRRLDEAVRKAELAEKNAEQFTEEIEKEKREDLLLERIGQRRGDLDWATIGANFQGKNPDDLTMINGIDEFTAKKLNSLGIFTYEQISRFDEEISEAVNDYLELLPGKVTEFAWAKQAITMLGLQGVDKSARRQEDDDSVIANLSAGQIKWAQIGKAGDRKSDVLTMIKGVDAETEKKLKVLGIRTFEQISRMDNETAEAVNGALGLVPGRVSKMMWAEQAKALKKG
ncbi:MAG: YqiA/YcfP family alpha/beta fold hydrolase [Candidatus Thalassarchaeaceae archaeon]|nr:YqiA/YcfP family alpha/beta fold hydrolase [Candidatus Thalassarchaeaceae archaeon]